MPPALLVVIVFSASATEFAASAAENTIGNWSCEPLTNVTLAPRVFWVQQNCTGIVRRAAPFWGETNVGPVIVNMVSALLSADKDSPRLRPEIARTSLGLAKLHDLAATAAQPDFAPLAGVNGGYFFEVNREDFLDDVCFGKSRRDALANVSLSDPNTGIGDGLTIMRGRYVSSNCDKIGNSKPVAAVLDYPPRFVKMERAQRLPPGIEWAIAAGPNLVSRNASTGESRVDIEGDNVNILEHASNTALGIRAHGRNRTQEFLLVTFDGIDGCVEYKPTCGVNSWQFASFMLDYLKVETAMEMDQGGSTAMWVKGQSNTGIVTNPGHSERLLFNGLFVGV